MRPGAVTTNGVIIYYGADVESVIYGRMGGAAQMHMYTHTAMRAAQIYGGHL